MLSSKQWAPEFFGPVQPQISSFWLTLNGRFHVCEPGISPNSQGACEYETNVRTRKMVIIICLIYTPLLLEAPQGKVYVRFVYCSIPSPEPISETKLSIMIQGDPVREEK